jgi:hypothetical protein
METNKQNQFVDVTQPPFNAVGDRKTDDAPAFQRAVEVAQERFGSLRREAPRRSTIRSLHRVTRS